MATRANYAKVGLFVILGLGAAVTMTIAIGARRLHKTTLSYFTYFNESVTGLEVGAPVRLRGVAVGQVGEIGFAPDRRTVEVRSDIDLGAVERLGLRPKGGPSTTPVSLPPELRAQLASQGLLGIRYVALDFFDPQTNQPPALSFETPERYIPSAKSLQKDLEESAARTLSGVAAVVDTLVRGNFSQKLVDVAGSAGGMLSGLDRVVTDVDRQQIPRRATETIEGFHAVAGNANKVLARLGGDAGLVASAQKTIGSFGEVGRGVSGATRTLDNALGEIGDAAAAIRLLADELERDPDMLIKGRAGAAHGKSP
jgi:paraquat-inducible protein B